VPPFERGLTLGDFLVPIRLGERAALWQRNLLMIAVGTLFIILGARISFFLPNNPLVPITLQTFAVLFGGALLGMKRSLASVGLYLLIGIVGFPVFAFNQQTNEYMSGIGTFFNFSGGTLAFGVRGGYLVGFLLAGGLVGRLAELGWDRHIGGSIGAMFLGNVAIYVVGIPWLMAATGLGFAAALEVGMWPFLLGDAIKLIAAAGLLPVGWWVVSRRSSER
jgi:biotin transport system substrate-specific component